ncbi:MAG: glycosyltransferase, partial [Acidobacteriota bacterium]
RFWLRYPLLFATWLARPRSNAAPPSFILVPEFGQKDVPLAKFLALLTSRKLVFDPLASRFETKILDWRRKPSGSLAAWWNKAIDRWAFRLSDLVLADTEAHKNYYCREFGLDQRKVAVVPVGFDDRIFSPNLAQAQPPHQEGSSAFTVIFFGSFLPLHGVEAVVEAADRVAKEDRSIRFHFIGSGQTLGRVRRLASDFRLNNVTFEGWLSPPKLAERISWTADICLGLFGRTEKAGRVVPHKVFQSMALRKPVITARTLAAEEFFSDRENILFCRSEDPATLARAILELKQNSMLREKIAQKGHDLVWERFHPGALGAALKEILGGGLGFPNE